MQLRRPVAVLVTALALFGGGTTALTGCGDPAGLDRRDGTPDDNTQNTSGNDPGSDSQGNLPDTTNQDPGNEEEQDDDTTDPD